MNRQMANGKCQNGNRQIAYNRQMCDLASFWPLSFLPAFLLNRNKKPTDCGLAMSAIYILYTESMLEHCLWSRSPPFDSRDVKWADKLAGHSDFFFLVARKMHINYINISTLGATRIALYCSLTLVLYLVWDIKACVIDCIA